MAHRYFLSGFAADKAYVDGAEASHLLKVMRVKPGDRLTLTDRRGFDYLVEVESSAGGILLCDVLEKRENRAEPGVKLTVYSALPKSDKLEFIAQKMCELGACSLVPFVSEYCVAQKGKNEAAKLARLQKISDEACKQSGRSVPMAVENTLSFSRVCRRAARHEKTILFYEKGGAPLDKAGIEGHKDIAVIIGSEGGFSEREAEALTKSGALTVTLGKRILRCETAAVTARSLVMYLAGELG